MKRLVILALLFSAVAAPVFAEEAADRQQERTCKNSSCTCNPCECNPCSCKVDENFECCACPDGCNCPGDNDDSKNNK